MGGAGDPGGYDGLLLDHDGVIVTLGDRDALTRAAETALRRAGVADPPADVVETLRISVDPAELETAATRLGVEAAALWRHRDDAVAEALTAEARAGRKAPYRDADLLREVDLPLGVVSNNQTRVVEFVLERYDLREAVETVHARAPNPESLARKKPAPTFLEESMAALGVENPLYVGDSESDVVAGRRAGLDVAFLRRPHRDGYDLGVTPDYDLDGLDGVLGLLGAPG